MIHTDGKRTIANAPEKEVIRAKTKGRCPRPSAAELKKLCLDRDLARSC